MKAIQIYLQIATFLSYCVLLTSLLGIFFVLLPVFKNGFPPFSLKVCPSHWITEMFGLGFDKAEVVKTSGRGEGDTF